MFTRIILMMIVFASYAAAAGDLIKKDDAKPENNKEVVKKVTHLIFTSAAKKELKIQKNKKWLISYNGTCSDQPALGFYQDDGTSDSDGLVVQQAGVIIFVEQKIVCLFEEWGAVIVDCTDYNGAKPGGKQFIAAFKKADVKE